uniref:HAT C-terminal dimerisation domain-containing protein n=1 Tax=Sipha flava TaxID=143950 RepID=A0A2S2QDV0_9HEMI
MLFGKMYSSNNIADNFEAHLNLYLERDLIGSFDNIYFIYKIFLSIPLSSASSERLFSSLRHLKTLTRNTIDQERFSNMAILHVGKTFKINFNTIIDQFDADSTERGRRLQLS